MFPMLNSAHTITTPAEFTFVDDIQSPFKLYPGELIVPLELPREPMSFTALDCKILEAINLTLVSTSRILLEHLKQLFGITVSPTQLRRRLHLLMVNEFLRGYRFRNPDGVESKMIAYHLAWRGNGWLKTQGIAPQKTSYLPHAFCDALKAKRLLAVAQFIVRMNVKSPYLLSKVLKPADSHFIAADNTLAPIVRTSYVQTDAQTLFLEAVRSHTGWQDDIINKLQRYALCFKEKGLNLEILKPVIILICESRAHQREVMDLLKNVTFAFELIFTSDTLIYQDTAACLWRLPERRMSFFARLLAG